MDFDKEIEEIYEIFQPLQYKLTFVLYELEDLEDAQMDAEEEIDVWKDGWRIIGYNDLLGDVFFIDTNKEGYPVIQLYDEEEEKILAKSLKSFKAFVKEVINIKNSKEKYTLDELNYFLEEKIKGYDRFKMDQNILKSILEI
ncbi:hypothetical protein [Clostridium sardiniense]|uniref:hypothetical protein n=1 Tax=Clostridium sardiniense TaxID=29369 RepID=UPI00195A1927|nr:hypothetical protein [Clostridium sardiniense]MBM7835264.1 hypothetical protein [Clostridium sardiniense]